MWHWTHRHCRSFHRALSSSAWLYTEMVTTQAILHGDRDRLLGRGEEGGRVALQLGGNDPAVLAACARGSASATATRRSTGPAAAERSGPRGVVRRPPYGDPGRRCRMRVSDARRRHVPATVKHRIGIDRREDYDFVRDFVGTVARAGCRRFIVHARNAWLDGLSPKENREVPPLRYDVVTRLAGDFPDCVFELNGACDLWRKANGGRLRSGARCSGGWLITIPGRRQTSMPCCGLAATRPRSPGPARPWIAAPSSTRWPAISLASPGTVSRFARWPVICWVSTTASPPRGNGGAC